jgi:hypothetical protein
MITEAAHAFNLAEQPVEHVAPVAQHVEDDAAALGLAIVPRRPLRRLPVAFEHPVAEIALDREDAPEEAALDQPLQLDEAGKEQLVLDDAMLQPGRPGLPIERQRIVEGFRARLLDIKMLARGDRPLDIDLAQIGRCRVEIDRVAEVGEGPLEMRRRAPQPV